MTTLETLRLQIEHAPQNPGPIADNLAGWNTKDGLFLCSRCAGRILARGCNLPHQSDPVWHSVGGASECCLCSTTPADNREMPHGC